MAKTKEELNEIKKEVEALNKKLAELSEEELEQVSGGNAGTAGKLTTTFTASQGLLLMIPD